MINLSHIITRKSLAKAYDMLLLYMSGLGFLTLFYESQFRFSYYFIGCFTIITCLFGFLLIHSKRDINVRLVGIMLATSIYSQAALRLSDLIFYDSHHFYAQLTAVFVWCGFGVSFISNWLMILEPFLNLTVQSNWRQRTFRESTKQKPPCLNCQKNKLKKV